MPVPSYRVPVRVARGTYANLSANLASLEEGEVVYANDEDRLYVVEGGVLVATTSSATGGASSLDGLSDASGYQTVGAMAERPTFDAAWPGTFPNLANDSWAFGTTGNISGRNLYVDNTPAGFDPSPNQYTKWRMTFDGSHTYILNCLDVVAQDGGARYVWTFSQGAGSGIDGVASEEDDFFAMRDEVLANGWNTSLRIEAVDTPSAGQALVWNGDRSQFEPETLASDVTSVNTQTGAVSLGVSDLDDVVLPSVASPSWAVTAVNNHSAIMLSGQAYTSASLWAIHPTAIEGDQKTDMQAWFATLSFPTDLTFIFDGVETVVTATAGADQSNTSGAYRPRFYFSIAGYAENAFVGQTMVIKEFSTYLGLEGTAADGDVLAWNDANGKWEPAALDGTAVRAALGIGEYVNDAAAGTGGVASGAMYYNTTSSDYRLKS